MSENKSEKDYLSDFIKKNEPTPEIEKVDENIQTFGNNVRQKVDYIESSEELEWHNIEIEAFPYSKYYPLGTKIFIRAAKTKEIEAFSVINEQNPYDVHTKIIQLLKRCVQIKYIDGSYGTYKDIIYNDRDVLLMLIANLSFENNRAIEKKVECTKCGHENTIKFIPTNYVFIDEPEKIKKYFNTETRAYDFTLKTGVKVSMKPPTIGLIESLNTYIFHNTLKSREENAENKVTYEPNISFMEIIPYLLSGRGIGELSIQEWKQEEFEFERLNKQLFMFVDDAKNLLNVGIDRVEQNCERKDCDNKNAIPFQFPDGIRSLFIIPNAFDDLIS